MKEQRCATIYLPNVSDNNSTTPARVSRPYVIDADTQFKLPTDPFKRKYSFGKYAAIAMIVLGAGALSAARGQAVTPATPPAQATANIASSGQSVAPANIRVVRLSYVQGSVQILRGNETEFSQALMNMPIVQGSRIATGEDGRAEVEFEDGSVARLTPNSSLNISVLEKTSDGTLKTTLEQISGLAYYELRSDPKIPFTVVFGNRMAAPTANATFRVDLDASPVDLAVLTGRMHVQAGQSGGADSLVDVQQGTTIQFNPGIGGPYNVANVVTPNPYDPWNDQRDHAAAEEAANETAARKQQGGGGGPIGSLIGYGWSDLDNSGGWYPLSGYGMVWQPDGGGEAGFDPYGSGGWAMTEGLGYSWVSGYSWGWLPFHYGMWSYIDGFGWGWMPGMFGYGGYGGYGGGYSTYTTVAGSPGGYAPPKPPVTIGTPVKGGKPPKTYVPVNRPTNGGLATGMALHANKPIVQAGTTGARPRPIHFRGSEVEPLRPMMHNAQVPIRNAALYNNYPADGFHNGIRAAMMERSGAILHGGSAMSEMRNDVRAHLGGLPAQNREEFAASHREFNGRTPFDKASRSMFGQRTNFGSHGGFGAVQSNARGGAGFHSIDGGSRSPGMDGMRGGGGMHGSSVSGSASSGGSHSGGSGGHSH